MSLIKSYSRRLLLLLGFALISAVSHASAKIYVSTSGNDSNQGTKEFPLASLKGAVSKVQALPKDQKSDGPVEIIIGDGSYFMAEPLVLEPGNSGTENSPLVFKAEPGAHPVFYGGKIISGFEKVSENLWKARIPEVAETGWYFEQLYVNGKRAIRAKSPNKGFYYLKDVAETFVDKGKGRTADLAVQKFKLFQEGIKEVSAFSANDFEDAVVTLYHKWDNTRKRITGFNPDSMAIYTVGQGMKPWNIPDRKTRYTIENFKAALDTCGEWYLDRSGELYYISQNLQ